MTYLGEESWKKDIFHSALQLFLKSLPDQNILDHIYLNCILVPIQILFINIHSLIYNCFIRFNDGCFILGEIKYYIKNKGKMKPFIAKSIEYNSTYDLEMIKFVEARETQNETVIIKPYNTIINDGMYVDKKDLDWYENTI